MVQQVRYNRTRTPEMTLDSAYTTIGKEKAEEMGLVKHGFRTFSFQHVKTLEGIVGNVVVMDLDLHMNFSTSDDGIRNYGGLTGSAGINLKGQPTLQSTIPAIVIPDRKQNNRQNAAVRESFAALCNANESKMGKVEVNPADVYLFQESSMKNGVGRSLVVIEAAGIFGEDTEGKAVYWSIMQYPPADFPAPKVEKETPKSKKPTNRTHQNRPAPATSSSKEHELHAETEKELATVS